MAKSNFKPSYGKQIKQSSIEEPKKEEVKKEDRSAFNCEACKGEGLQGQLICPDCSGTGKAK